MEFNTHRASYWKGRICLAS